MVTVKHVTFDALDPAKLAQFWSKVTGQPVENDWGGFVVLKSSADWPALAFYKTDQPKTVKDRIHLDLKVENLDSETKRLTALGAKLLSEHESEHLTWYVMADLEGNEFCLSSQW